MRNTIWLSLLLIFLSSGLFAQTASSPPAGSATYTSPTDNRSIGWTGGKTFYDTSSNWQSFVSPCLAFGFNDTLFDVINGNNNQPPNMACSGMSDVVYDAGASDLANGIIVYTGTTTYYYINTSGWWTTNSSIPVRVTIDFDKAVTYYNSMLLIKVDNDFSYNVIYEAYSPSGARYFSGGANIWTPAITLFDNLHTSTSRSICSSFDEGSYYTFTVQDSAWDSGNGSYAAGDSIMLFSNNNPAYTYSWTGPNSFVSTQAYDTILNATSSNGGTYYLTVTDGFSCPVFDSLEISVSSYIVDYDTITNCGSYTWRGNLLSMSGDYSDTVNVVSGPDSIFHLNLTINPIPTADFSFTNTCFGHAITFSNNSAVSSGSITNNAWSFGDGQNSSDASPVHSYAVAGNYNVQLIVTTDKACKDTLIKQATTHPKPNADFSFTNACLDDGITFTNTSSVSSGSITAYEWTFGDGQSSSATSPIHQYASAGNYTVQLIVTTDNSCKDTVSKSVTVYPKPNADFNFANACLDDGISFTDNSNVSSGSITAYDWNFGDGQSSALTNPSHMYAASGNYNVTLIVTTNNSCKDTISKSVTVYPKPNADFSFSNACLDEGINFKNLSNISSGSLTSYNWDFGDGQNSTAQHPYHYYSTAGTYSVTLIVTSNNSCKDTINKSVTIHPKPNADFNFANACLDDGISFTDNSSVSSGSITAYNWSFGDGQSSTLTNPSHMYTASGNYNVILIVTTNNFCKDTILKSVTIYPKPNADFTFSNACLDDGISFTDNSNVSSGSITAYNWNFGDGQTSALTNPSHMYAASGNYNVTLIVTTNNSCKDTIAKSVTVYPKPDADFSFNSACLDDGINFKNLSSISSGSITSYSWNFGDGQNSTSQHPYHYYATEGTYNVTLIVTSNNSCKDTISKSVTVYPKPNADFSFSNACLDDGINFKNLSSISSGSLIAYNWDFGDGQNSTAQHPYHYYSTAGTYSVTLIVTSNNSCKDTINKSVTIHPKPNADFNFTNACLDDGISFTDNSSVSSGSITAYNWSFGDGQTSTLTNPSHMYSASGNYNVTLVVITNNSCKDTLVKSVTVYPKPSADFTAANECLDNSVNFTNNSSISSGSITAYSWNFDDGMNSVQMSPSHKYAASGSYDVELIITSNNACKDTIEKSITVYPKPVADFSAANVCYGLEMNFVNSSSVSSGSLITYAWNFGDGNSSSSANPSHMYAASGTYSVQLIVTTDHACKDTISKSVTVYPKPVADYIFSNACQDDGIHFTNSSSVSSGNIISNTWMFGDGKTSSAVNPYHYYANEGNYNTTLTVTTNNGCLDTVSKSITVYPKPVANFVNTAECVNEIVSFTDSSTVISGSIQSYLWDMGDLSGTTTVKNPLHLYNTEGSYNVQLIVTTNNNCKDTLVKTVSISPVPTASFTTMNNCVGDSSSFTNNSTISAGTLSYVWDFGDGTTSTLSNPTHLYASSGTYTVSLKAVSVNGCEDIFSSSIVIYAKPNVNFTSNEVCYGQSTSFTNYSSGGTNYTWDLGDASTSMLSDPVHMYAASGNYTVKLIVSNNEGCKDSLVKTVIVNARPMASFTANDACENTQVSFTNTSSITPNENLSHQWSFGDNSSSTAFNPSHTYSNPGSFTPALVVTSASGCRDTATINLSINEAPVAMFTTPDVCETDTSVFTNTSSISAGTISYHWNFGDGDTSILNHPTHVYANAGNKSVVLVATSDKGCSNTYSSQAIINPLPVAGFMASDVCDGTSVNFNNTSSVSSGTNSYNWNFGDGQSSLSTSPAHLYSSAGMYTVQLIATTNKGCVDSVSDQIDVNPVPVASFTTMNVCGEDSVIFTNTSSISSGTMTYAWNFGDGNNSSDMNPKHVYTSPGTYSVSLTVTSDKTCSDIYTTTVTIYPDPVAQFSTSDMCNGNPVSFTNTSTIASGTNSYAWSFGDGSASNNVSPTHTYASAGTYQVSLIAMSNNNCTDTVSKSITIYPQPTASFNVSDECFGETVSLTNSSSISSGSLSYHWDFGNGDTSVLENPTYLYGTDGTYTITLTTTSDNGCQVSTSKSVNIFPAPVLAFSAADVCYGNAVSFMNGSSVSSGTNAYVWSFGDGSTSNNVSPSHLYSAATTYSAKLFATTNNGCMDSLSKQISVHPVPVADFSATNVCDGENVVFTNSSTLSTGSMTYEWNFGDGNNSTMTSPQHVYNNAGTYAVKLLVTSDKMCADSLLKSAVVHPMPNVDFSVQNACLGTTMSFTNASTVSSGSNTYIWISRW
jgi:PKD repeat protein